MEINIYLFHRVSPHKDEYWPPVSPKHFERIVGYLTENYQVVQLEKFLTESGEYSGKKPIAAIVFDDGYKDILIYATPILEKYKVAYSIYVVSNCVDTGLPPWTYQLDWIFSQSRFLELNQDSDQLPEELRNTRWSSHRDRAAYGQRVKGYLKKQSNDERLRIFNHFKDSFEDVDFEKNLMLTWKDLLELQNADCHIGSHSKSHPILTNIKNAEDIASELKFSRARIREKLGKSPISISYPNGNYNALITEIAAKEGYQIGLAVGQKSYVVGRDSIMSIPRVQLYEESMLKTKLRMKGIVEKAKNLLGR